ncbi:MAG: hypothetical protein AB7H93_14350 [Vicinamibacterales bacterium]
MKFVVAIGAAALTVVSAAVSSAQPQTANAPPTYTKDVAPILNNRCAGCHRPGEVAPMSLLSYDEVRPWARAIRRNVVERVMPPWGAEAGHRKLRNDQSLSAGEIDTIVRWVDAGVPKGADTSVVPTPQFTSGWRGGEPDHVFKMPEFEVPAEGEIPGEYFWVQNPFEEDVWVSRLELWPGNNRVVHHIRMDIVNLPVSEGYSVVNHRLIGPDGKEVQGEQGGRSTDHLFLTKDSTFYLIAYVPGNGVQEYPKGTGKRIKAGQWIRFNLHYQATGRREIDQSRLGMWFAKTPVTREVYEGTVGQPLANASTELKSGRQVTVQGKPVGDAPLPNIPPYVEDWEIIGVTSITEPVTIYAFWPHMHLRGKSLKWVVTWPDGREETVLNVPRYDFNWQLNYELETPLRLPAGSRLTAIARYDNSLKNRFNPAPDQQVFWSQQSWDEMFSPHMVYTLDDQNLLGRTTSSQRR